MGMMSTHPNSSHGSSNSIHSIMRNKGIRAPQLAARLLLVASLLVTPPPRLPLLLSELCARYCIVWSVISCVELIYPERSAP